MVKLFDTKSLTKMMLNWSTYNCWFSFYFWRIFNFSLQGSDNSDILALQKARSKRQLNKSNRPETFWWASYSTIRILKTLDHLFPSLNFFFYLFDMFYIYQFTWLKHLIMANYLSYVLPSWECTRPFLKDFFMLKIDFPGFKGFKAWTSSFKFQEPVHNLW